MKFNTKLLHGKAVKRYDFGATLPPISQVSAFSYETAEQLEKVFNNKAMGFAYTRIGNPVVDAFEKRICEMENGASAVACSSGMAAISSALLNVLQAGDEIIASSGLFGGTIDLFRDLTSLGITTRYAAHITPEEIAPLINEKTKLVFAEVISNPGLEIIDIKAIADFVHSKNIPLFLDNTTATPYLVNPLDLGADIVIHSSSKYINGSSNSISGVIIDGGKFAWDTEKYPCLKSFSKFGPFAFTAKLRNDVWRNIGACLSPMNAYLNILGLETLGLRMDKICSNAHKLAEALNNLDGVEANYPLLAGNPYKQLAQSQLHNYGGAILTIRTGSKAKAYKIMNNLNYASIATNIGDVRTLVIHPASTIYIHNTTEQMHSAGVFDDTIRISVGIEDVADLIEDFTLAIENA